MSTAIQFNKVDPLTQGIATTADITQSTSATAVTSENTSSLASALKTGGTCSQSFAALRNTIKSSFQASAKAQEVTSKQTTAVSSVANGLMDKISSIGKTQAVNVQQANYLVETLYANLKDESVIIQGYFTDLNVSLNAANTAVQSMVDNYNNKSWDYKFNSASGWRIK